MLKLLFGITVGAILMYLFDPNAGGDRRKMLTDKVNKTDLPTAKEEAKATVVEAKERAKTVVAHTKDRFGETVDEARNEVSGFTRNAQDRVETVTNGQTDTASKN